MLAAYAAMHNWELDFLTHVAPSSGISYRKTSTCINLLVLNVWVITSNVWSDKANYTVFVFDHVNGKGVRVICIIVWRVDDRLVGSNNCCFVDHTKTQIAERFGITDLGAVTEYLSVQFV
jgi:hypothetical protein